MLKGYRTYLTIALGIAVMGAQAMGYLDPKTADLIASVLGMFGIYFRNKATK